MSSTPFSKKCEILKDYYMDTKSSNDVTDILLYMYDLGFPAAMLYLDDAVTLTDKGVQYVEDTWKGICEAFDIDHLGDYDSYATFMEIADAEEWQ